MNVKGWPSMFPEGTHVLVWTTKGMSITGVIREWHVGAVSLMDGHDEAYFLPFSAIYYIWRKV